MIGICLLFCLILWNVIGGTRGVGEVGNKNEKKDLLFGEVWRKAFEANRHNGKEAEEKEEMPKKEVKKEEQTEEEENKLWKKVKMEPIEDKLKVEDEEEERDGKKWKKTIKKEPKIEENISANDQNNSDQSAADDDKKIESESEKLAIVKEYEKRRKEYKRKNKTKGQYDSKISREIAKEMGEKLEEIYKWKKEIRTKNKPIINNETKLEIIKAYDKMRNESKISGEYNNKIRAKIEQKIAKELGTYRDKIFEWKKELNQKKNPESEKEKWEIIENFEKMRKECKDQNKYTNKNIKLIEREIAKELGTCRTKIYRWKKEFKREKESESEEEKWQIIKQFNQMRKEYKMKKDYKNKNHTQIEQKIAKALGTYRDKIYEWKNELINREKKVETEEEKWEIIARFDKMREEYKMKKDYKWEDRIKIERKIAKELGTYRTNIYEWKSELIQKSKTENEKRNWEISRTNILEKTFTPQLRKRYTRKQKRAIVEKFDNLCEQFSNKFNMKTSKKIEEKIAKKFYISRISIYRWKKAMKIK